MDIVVDLRCLQDVAYRHRGIGANLQALLRSRHQTKARNRKVSGLIHPGIGDLPEELRLLCDTVVPTHQITIPSRGIILIDPSPMTHDLMPVAHLTGHASVFKASFVHDFIPLDCEGYLNSIAEKVEYTARLTQLRKSNLFLANSRYTANRLRDLLGIPEERICVTGAAVRACMFRHRSGPADHPRSNRFNRYGRRPYFVVVGGEDKRKNVELAVRAVRMLRAEASVAVRLVIVGDYGEATRQRLVKEATSEGDWPFVDFQKGLADEVLCELYEGAIAAVAPSRAEGFSLPVIEAAACGTPTLVSNNEAHRELVKDADAFFDTAAPEELAAKLYLVLRYPAFRQRLLKSQQVVAADFHEDIVGRRFWDRVVYSADEWYGRRAPRPIRSTRPKVAFVSPYPPDESGVARYTQQTISAARKRWDVTLFTDATRPLPGLGGFTDGGPISLFPFISNGYDCVISVVGNSAFHLPIIRLHGDFGGPAILHDSRLTQLYYYVLGRERFREYARTLIERSVSDQEIDAWLDERPGPSLFVEAIADRAHPLIVHTRRFQQILEERYGYKAEIAPFCPNFSFEAEDLAPHARHSARVRLGIPKDTFVVATFGIVDIPRKGIAACVAALDHLRAWGIPAELYCVGDAGAQIRQVEEIARDFGVASQCHFFTTFVDTERYRDFLVAADAAVQLRNYKLGQASAALADCISAGLPTVATEDLAASCDAPGYVRRVPDEISALLVAEQLAGIYDSRTGRSETEEQRREYWGSHNFDRYVERLQEILGLD